MRHYWGIFDTSIKHSKVQCKVLDTLDLTMEEVNECDIYALMNDFFINNIFVDGRIINQESRSLLLKTMNLKLSEFNFPIKNGNIKYTGEKLIIEFFGKTYNISLIDPFILLNNETIISRNQDGFLSPFSLYIEKMNISDYMGSPNLEVTFSFHYRTNLKPPRKVMRNKSFSLIAVFYYNEKTVNILSTHPSDSNLNLKSYLNCACEDAEYYISQRSYDKNVPLTSFIVNFVFNAIGTDILDDDTLKRLIKIYIAYEALGVDIKNLDKLFKKYDKVIGFDEELKLYRTKFKFFNKRGTK